MKKAHYFEEDKGIDSENIFKLHNKAKFMEDLITDEYK